MTTQDPAALFRAMLGEWAGRVGEDGQQPGRRSAESRPMFADDVWCAGATLNAQAAAYKGMAERALAAGKLPARDSAPRPTRTRKPPEPQE